MRSANRHESKYKCKNITGRNTRTIQGEIQGAIQVEGVYCTIQGRKHCLSGAGFSAIKISGNGLFLNSQLSIVFNSQFSFLISQRSTHISKAPLQTHHSSPDANLQDRRQGFRLSSLQEVGLWQNAIKPTEIGNKIAFIIRSSFYSIRRLAPAFKWLTIGWED